jgi:hypothetical protein
MSVQAQAWALAQQSISCRAKLVLLSLAHHADYDNTCWPSFKLLSIEANSCRRTIITLLKELETAGLIQKEHRLAEGGRQTSNRYRLLLNGNRLEGAKSAPLGGEGAIATAPPRVQLHAPPNEPSKEIKKEARPRRAQDGATWIPRGHPQWEQLCKRYQKEKGKCVDAMAKDGWFFPVGWT